MKATMHIVGPPTDAGAWPMVLSVSGLEYDAVPGVGDAVILRPSKPFVHGIVAHVQWHDDRVDLTVEGDSLRLPAGLDDWRAVMAPNVVGEHLAEEAEAFLDGWWTP